MEALRIQLSGPTASFRYPHFLVGRQPTYPMPPPSTIYGLLACAAGEFPDPRDVRFAYSFKCAADRIDDLEKVWILAPEQSSAKRVKSDVLPREWLIFPKLTLYLAAEELGFWDNAFRQPGHPLVLGRSQDLVSLDAIDRIDLSAPGKGRLSPGLYSMDVARNLPTGEMVRMPRLIEPSDRRQRSWGLYVAVTEALPFDAANSDVAGYLLADSTKGDEPARLIEFHSFQDDD